MDTEHPAPALAAVAAAIAEPARSRMLCALMDGRARTATELAAVAGVAASTASAHLGRLTAPGLVTLVVQGRHRYFRLADPTVGQAIEALMAVAGRPAASFAVSTPHRLRHARTCYDHLAGTLGVQLHDAMLAAGWLTPDQADAPLPDYVCTTLGRNELLHAGVTMPTSSASRRRFACACLDWSERRPHLGGALGAAVLTCLLQRDWVRRDAGSRALQLTAGGKRALREHFGIVAAEGAGGPAGQTARGSAEQAA